MLGSTDGRLRHPLCNRESNSGDSPARGGGGGRGSLFRQHCNNTLQKNFPYETGDGFDFKDKSEKGPVAMEMLRSRKSSTVKYWAAVLKSLESTKKSSKGRPKYFTKELRIGNVTQDIIDAKNLTCRAANTPELTPVTKVLKVIPFG